MTVFCQRTVLVLAAEVVIRWFGATHRIRAQNFSRLMPLTLNTARGIFGSTSGAITFNFDGDITVLLTVTQHDRTPTQKRPATLPKPSFSTLRAQSPTSPRNYYRCQDQRIGGHLRDLHRTREPPGPSSPTGRNPQCDRKPSGRPPTSSCQPGCVMDNLMRNRGGSLLVQRSDDGSR